MSSEVIIVKDSKKYSIECLKELEVPFIFRGSDGKEYEVKENEKPLFFKRTRVDFENGRAVRKYIHRFCLGSILPEGKQKRNWLMPDGSFEKFEEFLDKKTG